MLFFESCLRLNSVLSVQFTEHSLSNVFDFAQFVFYETIVTSDLLTDQVILIG